MENHQPTLDEFLNHTKNHRIKILHDDGLYRHLRFQIPDTMNRYFDIVTFPGHLCYVGDMGSFTFTRIQDMFQFFRSKVGDNGGKQLYINTGYWAEKLEAVDKTDGYEEFDKDRFLEIINEYRVRWIKDGARNGTLSKEERRELWEAVDYEVLHCLEDGEFVSYDAASSFSYKIGLDTFEFTDLWEHNFKRYSYRFVWCCYAIVWGIQEYDQAKKHVNGET